MKISRILDITRDSFPSVLPMLFIYLFIYLSLSSSSSPSSFVSGLQH